MYDDSQLALFVTAAWLALSLPFLRMAGDLQGEKEDGARRNATAPSKIFIVEAASANCCPLNIALLNCCERDLAVVREVPEVRRPPGTTSSGASAVPSAGASRRAPSAVVASGPWQQRIARQCSCFMLGPSSRHVGQLFGARARAAVRQSRRRCALQPQPPQPPPLRAWGRCNPFARAYAPRQRRPTWREWPRLSKPLS